MKKLNSASFDIWTEFLKDENHQKITDRILILDTYETLSPDEASELEILINIEQKGISETEEIVENNKKYLKVFNRYKKLLEKNEKLLAIFFDRVNENLLQKETCVESDLTEIYIALMEEDLDVEGHEKLNELYKTFVKQEEGECTTPNCIYCTPISKDEYNDAFEDLENQGFFDKSISEQERMVKLMVTIHRLQDELVIYKPTDDEEGELDDEDDE